MTDSEDTYIHTYIHYKNSILVPAARKARGVLWCGRTLRGTRILCRTTYSVSKNAAPARPVRFRRHRAGGPPANEPMQCKYPRSTRFLHIQVACQVPAHPAQQRAAADSFRPSLLVSVAASPTPSPSSPTTASRPRRAGSSFAIWAAGPRAPQPPGRD